MKSGIGNERPQDRIDANRDGVADAAARDFEEAGRVQPQPADQPPKVEPDRKPEPPASSGQA